MIKKKDNVNIIVRNKKVAYSYFVEKKIEAGLSLQGWEVKSLRKKKVNIENSYVIFQKKEMFLSGSIFTPVSTIDNSMSYSTMRNKKLLLKKKEISFLYGKMMQEKYSIVSLFLFWKREWCKIVLGIAKGKSIYDKRKSIKDREWKRSKERLLKNSIRL